MAKKSTEFNYIFGVDLDGVCADFYQNIRPLAAEWLGVDEKSLVHEVSYGLKEWGIDKAPGGYLDFHKWAVTQKDLFSNLQPMQGCPQALRRISKEMIRIRIITHRLFVKYFHRQAIQQTIDWLERHGIPYWDLCFMQEKAHVGADIYIDDAEKNIVSLKRHNCKVITFSNSTNTHMKVDLRAKNWHEVEAIIMQDFKSAKRTKAKGKG